MEGDMFRKLVKTAEVEIEDRIYCVRYYELKTVRGVQRFSSEVTLSPGDRVILDDDSMSSLESKVLRLVPATIYSRELAARISVAA
jgi:hypothetical protein